MNFIHVPSMLVTFGGALFAVMITSDSFADYLDGLKSFPEAFHKCKINEDMISEQILEMSSIARKEGLLVLEERADGIESVFLKKGIRLIVDGTDPELVKDILETELLQKEERIKKRIHFWEDLGAYAPAWGMVGTLLGLINMMRSMGTDAASIGSGMALALITDTLWLGSGKLGVYSDFKAYGEKRRAESLSWSLRLKVCYPYRRARVRPLSKKNYGHF